jgi:DNA polymerase III subunit epsilon
MKKLLVPNFFVMACKTAFRQKTEFAPWKKALIFAESQDRMVIKWPKLSELHYKLFKTNFEEAHNAAVDISTTAKCFWELRRLGKI